MRENEFGKFNAVHYVGSLLDGTKFKSTRDADKPFTIKLGQGEFIDFIYDLHFANRIILMVFSLFCL